MKYLKVHTDCLVVTGVSRSLICDTIRGAYYLIPNALAAILKEFDGQEIEMIHKEYPENKEIIEEYINFLIENEFIFFCDSKEEISCFPPISLDWDFPGLISNAIIEINDAIDYPAIFAELEQLGCTYLSLNSYRAIGLNKISQILKLLDTSAIASVELLIKYADDIDAKQVELLVQQYPRITRVIVHTVPEKRIEETDFEGINTSKLILFTHQAIHNHSHCGQVSPAYFTNNISHIAEAQLHNTCLNRKISINEKGYIKNCPAMPQSFGNIKDSSLAEALARDGFKDLWFVNKDQINTCKTCEFRYICTDCRAFVENPGDIYAKPLKCGYDPATCEWEAWSENPLKQKATRFYGFSELEMNLSEAK